ncbi:MAG: thioredoxin-dependent thiol peroxidase [Bacteroidetes bacterium]|nr:thioredoxin-dependent thiol peroxidase [Bacteroidota bacterium]
MASLKIGDIAPDFKGIDQNGDEVSLQQFRGKKVILYFYPKDDTPGCTAEACNLRDNYQALLNKGFAVIGVSADSEQSHKKFAEKFTLPFSLIADTAKDIINEYGVWGPKKFMGKSYEGINRVTFVISENGTIEKVFDKVKTKEHTEQILSEYE